MRLTTLILTGLSVGLLSCGESEAPRILAKVGSHAITVLDFEKEVARRRAANRPIPDKQTLLDEMIARRALLQRAEETGLDRNPDVQREIENLLIGELQERELTPRLGSVEITEQEIRAEYERRIEGYTRPARVRLAILYLETQPKMSDAKRTELLERLREARRKAMALPSGGQGSPSAPGFGPLAVEYSQDQASRYRGGDIGWLEPDRFEYRWPEPVLRAGYKLETGEISDVLETEAGFYLVRKTDARPSQTTPLEQVQAALRQSLLVEKRRELKQAFRRESLRRAKSEINRSVLAGVTVSETDPALARREASRPPDMPGTSQ